MSSGRSKTFFRAISGDGQSVSILFDMAKDKQEKLSRIEESRAKKKEKSRVSKHFIFLPSICISEQKMDYR